MEQTNNTAQKILLVLLPFWTPYIPPLGITCLKSYIQRHGYNIKCIDVNVETEFKNIYHQYFELLKNIIPETNRGNFYNIGNDILRNQMMAHSNYDDEIEYRELVKEIISLSFYCEITDEQVSQISKLLDIYYHKLKKYICALIERENPKYLGLSVYSGNFASFWYVSRMVKKNYPNITIVMGGGIFADQLNYGSPNFHKFLGKADFIDKIIIGEGEVLFLKFLRNELNKNQKVYTLNDVSNECLRINDLNNLDFSDYNLKYYPYLVSYTSRSCPYQCAFCSETIQWGKYRRKDVKLVVEELLELNKRYGYQLFLMGDSLLNPVVAELSHEFKKEKQAIYWDGYLRVDDIVCNIENTFLWRRSGFYRARLGIESGSQEVLQAMNKRITTDQIKSSLFNLAQAGIKTTTYWVIGYPGETESDFQQTLNLLEELRFHIYEAECNPFNYYLTGQASSDTWAKEYKSDPLYSRGSDDMLITQSWLLYSKPERKEIYERVMRFVECCIRLGIPNPYSYSEIYNADERWKKLHKNAVPALFEFNERNNYVNDFNHVKNYFHIRKNSDDGDFKF